MSFHLKQSLDNFVGAISPGTSSPSLAFIESNFAAKAAPKRCCGMVIGILALSLNPCAFGQTLPGDAMIHDYLSDQARQMHDTYMQGVESKEDWLEQKPRYMEEYFHMLGLSPMPEKTPLKPTVTGTLAGDGYMVDMLHYQSSPGLYVTANLYRPVNTQPGEKLPAILYVCGHAERGRNGNKTAYQSHGIWFARHGYVCLMVDTVQRGEIKGMHHGTYRYNRWWWQSRGYTPAGVECWNGIRGIDYLTSRPDVDAQRIGVTGISGGGAVTFWVAAADERVKAAIPVSGMADLPSYLGDHVINGHCDCMFIYNTFQWPWTRIAALIAPRPLLFVNSDHDPLFPMNANERVSNRLESMYSFFGAGDQVETLVSIGGHSYREDIRKASFRFMNIHLKNDPSPVLDSEMDIVTGDRGKEVHPIPPEKLRVFPTDADIPEDELTSTIDQHFVPMAKVELPQAGSFEIWKNTLVNELKRVTFRGFPDRIPAATLIETGANQSAIIETEPGIKIGIRKTQSGASPKRLILIVNANGNKNIQTNPFTDESDDVYICDPRGIGATQWSVKNPPNYVARSFALLGRTVDDGRVWDVAATARYVSELHKGTIPVYLAGEGAGAVLAACAMLLEPAITGALLDSPQSSHMEESCPPLLNVLRVCDVPDTLGALAPRSITLKGADAHLSGKVTHIYKAAGAESKLTILPVN